MLWRKGVTPLFVFIFWLLIQPVAAQFAPVVGIKGSTAIYKDDNVFVEWATGCLVQRGPVNIADTSLGYASAGNEQMALGKADDATVSLGDGGMSTLTFANPVYDGPGFDFAVFENGFFINDSNLAFLELGFVEVSSDGVHFFRFPAITDVQDTLQLSNDGTIDGSQLYNFAGKYTAGYGTPFDLEELKGTPGLDVNNITHIRVIDVVGSLDSMYATRDVNGRKVNDPWPTPFASCGFDLDAVGVINARSATGISEISGTSATLYPNPVRVGEQVHIVSASENSNVKLTDLNGQQIFSSISNGHIVINTSGLSIGVYVISIESISSKDNFKLIVQ